MVGTVRPLHFLSLGGEDCHDRAFMNIYLYLFTFIVCLFMLSVFKLSLLRVSFTRGSWDVRREWGARSRAAGDDPSPIIRAGVRNEHWGVCQQ